MIRVSAITCPPIPWSRKMKTVTCPPGLAYGATCTFACEAGYDIIGEDKVTCERGNETSASGTWSSEPPKCDGELILYWRTTFVQSIAALV